MRTLIGLDELTTYRECPERERRRKLEPRTSIEGRYQDRLRTILVRFYSELMGEHAMSEAELRRVWSTMWDIPLGLTTRTFDKSRASELNATVTDDERMILRGASVLHRLCTRKLHAQIEPVVVDEPFTLELGQLKIFGIYDLVFRDKRGQYWIVDWTLNHSKAEPKYELRHAVLIEAFAQRTGHQAKVLVDYIRTLDGSMELSQRSKTELARQVAEAGQLALALAQDITYRRIGPHCSQCPFKRTCLGEQVVQAKRPRGRPRKHSVPSTAA